MGLDWNPIGKSKPSRVPKQSLRHSSNNSVNYQPGPAGATDSRRIGKSTPRYAAPFPQFALKTASSTTSHQLR